MRRYHRWLAVLFGIFLIWIATTGLLSQFAALYANGGFEKEEPAKPAAARTAGLTLIPTAQAHENEEAAPKPKAAPDAAAPANFVCPETMTCRPKAPPTGPRAWVGFFHHLHSGEQFGPAGVIVSILSGAALLFFAISGLWMYLQMFRARTQRQRAEHPLFWK